MNSTSQQDRLHMHLWMYSEHIDLYNLSKTTRNCTLSSLHHCKQRKNLSMCKIRLRRQHKQSLQHSNSINLLYILCSYWTDTQRSSYQCSSHILYWHSDRIHLSKYHICLHLCRYHNYSFSRHTQKDCSIADNTWIRIGWKDISMSQVDWRSKHRNEIKPHHNQIRCRQCCMICRLCFHQDIYLLIRRRTKDKNKK